MNPCLGLCTILKVVVFVKTEVEMNDLVTLQIQARFEVVLTREKVREFHYLQTVCLK